MRMRIWWHSRLPLWHVNLLERRRERTCCNAPMCRMWKCQRANHSSRRHCFLFINSVYCACTAPSWSLEVVITLLMTSWHSALEMQKQCVQIESVATEYGARKKGLRIYNWIAIHMIIVFSKRFGAGRHRVKIVAKFRKLAAKPVI